MEAVSRLLGLIAPVNERLGRHRLNLIPANVLLLFGLATFAVLSWNSVAKILANRTPPQPQSVGALISKTRFAQGYVAVEGRLMTNSRLLVGQNGRIGQLGVEDYSWVPLVDATTGRAVLVQFKADSALPPSSSDVTIDGILRPLPAVVARVLKENGYVYAGIPIARTFMVIAGRKPGSLQPPIVTGTVFGALALALAWSIVKRNVVFMPVDAPLSGGFGAPLESTSRGPLLVSGTLALDAKRRRFFTNMPAAVQRLDSGETAIVSHIQTSRTFFGVKTEEHSGVWMLVMRPGSVTDAQQGYVFWGLKKMRATRFRYVNALTGASERAVVAYPAES